MKFTFLTRLLIKIKERLEINTSNLIWLFGPFINEGTQIFWFCHKKAIAHPLFTWMNHRSDSITSFCPCNPFSHYESFINSFIHSFMTSFMNAPSDEEPFVNESFSCKVASTSHLPNQSYKLKNK